MAAHYRIRPKFWKGARRHWDDQAKLLALYLLTCEHRNLEGLYFLPKGYALADLGWPARILDRALAKLEAEGFCEYDEAAEVVFIIKALEHQAPTTDKQIQGAVASLQAAPDTRLWDAFLATCERNAPRLAESIRMEMKTHSNGSAIPLRSKPDFHSNLTRDPARTATPAPAPTHNSNSSSISTPPQPPSGGRARDRQIFEGEQRLWAQSLLRAVGVDDSDANVGQVLTVHGLLRAGRGAASNEAVLDRLRAQRPDLFDERSAA